LFLEPGLVQSDERARERAKLARRSTAPHLYMQIGISLALLAVGLYVIHSKQYTDADNVWPSGTLGTVIGFWLKG
jgi:hypothetical protein